jgi:hypothetical protein
MCPEEMRVKQNVWRLEYSSGVPCASSEIQGRRSSDRVYKPRQKMISCFALMMLQDSNVKHGKHGKHAVNTVPLFPTETAPKSSKLSKSGVGQSPKTNNDHKSPLDLHLSSRIIPDLS